MQNQPLNVPVQGSDAPEAAARPKGFPQTGLLYFYVHFVTEVICFYMLGRYGGDSLSLWFVPLLYDMLAFVPQALIGYVCDKRPRLQVGVPGLLLMSAALVVWNTGLFRSPIVSLVILCLGNACTHVAGAEVTLRTAHGKLGPSAIFVAGGSFGVITGTLVSGTDFPFWAMILLALTAVPFVLLAEDERRKADTQSDTPCAAFRYNAVKVAAVWVVLLATFIVIVRGYMGYGIPTAWKKTTFQTVMLFVTMGIGKGAGGLLADRFGVKKTAMLSAALALPFLVCGDQHMLVSLIGVMLFSMTMSITLALLVSVLPRTPGLAFGLTTIGLFLGTAPIFFFKLTTVRANAIMIGVLTIVCLLAMQFILRKDGKQNA
ncbi:MAG: hypothetical protein IJT44_01270 [Clostridia bacterium]|nr:hypothetical protein [Clostridia bacterium]